ncbi:protease inhibitor I42 family protein [Clostridium aestuarii]|uniref:Protease inhibitor I42 family protein n=1 Tax=Clostridium aestuarii TaxID=338193 RepID=A0ABT4D2H9_9CLOT|nr:protease inhibitor I42 family protein [Clostridium aestuarii]MCY6485449.1 protease inhibitor I42 family protein [Clostridium aestuarii]
MVFTKQIIAKILILCILGVGYSNELNQGNNTSNPTKMDELLSQGKYTYSTEIDKKYVAIMVYDAEKTTVKEYEFKNNGSVDITVPNNKDFIISLHANRTILYTWNIKNNICNGIVQFVKRSWIDIPLPKVEEGMCGMDYSRQNFYFKCIKNGNQKIVMRYEHQEEQRDEFFEVNFNIMVK